MFRPRIIPVLLLKGLGLVKTVKFKSPNYIGDPMNAVKIFNDLEADELVFLDISATPENRIPSLELVNRIGEEAFMPFSVGGGIKKVDDVRRIIESGAEKVVINSEALANPKLVEQAATLIGSQSTVVSIDVKKNIFGKKVVMTQCGKRKSKISPSVHAKQMVESGAGEIIINSIDHEGTGMGYDLDLIQEVADAVEVPVVALGGASGIADFKLALDKGAHAVAAGSLFVYQGPRKAVLINYPSKEDIHKVL